MNHSFSRELAVRYGLLEAIILQYFEFWIEKNEANEVNYYDGRTWTYNSIKAFGKIFPYASERKIRDAIRHLIDAGVLMAGNYNPASYDRTLWYAFTDLYLSILQKRKMEIPKTQNGNSQNVKPIPFNKPVIVPFNKIRTKVRMSEPDKPAPTRAPKESEDSIQFELAKKLKERILENKPNRKIDKNWQKNWANDIEKLHRLDKRSWEDIEKVINWSQDNEFWRRNILSGAKLREKIDRLEDEMAQEDKRKKGGGGVLDASKIGV